MARASPPSLPDELTLELGLDEADDELALKQLVAHKLGRPVEEIPVSRIAKRVIDARRGKVRFHLTVALTPAPRKEELGLPDPREVARPARVVIVGDGPAGLFCAYELARHGVASIVVDRGKTVQPRRIDLKGLNRENLVDEDSNYCHGEGGAGTYSDGKLYTRSTKRGDVRDVLEILARHDAPVDILTDARPHIGSNLLPKVVTSIREQLQACGVRFLFGQRVTGLRLSGSGSDRRIVGVSLQRTSSADEVGTLDADAVVLATGHSARDVYEFLHADGVAIEAKPFALGVRIEHPQPLINQIQYGAAAGHTHLPSAPYRLAHTVDAGGVFSFCMCPGGFIVPASTDATGLVVNGMSLKRRDSPFANSGLVASISLQDATRAGFSGPLALLRLQQALEASAKVAGGGTLKAPATRATDFVARRSSMTLPATSYQPGLFATDVGVVLDSIGIPVANRLREALRVFDRQMRGYLTDDAVLVGVESRTSAPVRILRDDGTLMSPGVTGLYPSGEGAGYAGGIVSAAIDGMRVARAIIANKQR